MVKWPLQSKFSNGRPALLYRIKNRLLVADNFQRNNDTLVVFDANQSQTFEQLNRLGFLCDSLMMVIVFGFI